MAKKAAPAKRAASAAPQKDEVTGTWWFVVDLPPGPDGQRRQVRRTGGQETLGREMHLRPPEAADTQ